MDFFEEFGLDHIDTGEAVLRVRWGGSGPPVVLLHGHPRTHVTWHAVAAELPAGTRLSVLICVDTASRRTPRSFRITPRIRSGQWRAMWFG